MGRIIPFKLNRNSHQQQSQRGEVPPTVVDRLARLRAEVEGLERLATTQAAEKELPSFMAFETMLKEKLDAVGRAGTELFLTHAHERVAAASKDGIQCGARVLRPTSAPAAGSQPDESPPRGLRRERKGPRHG